MAELLQTRSQLPPALGPAPARGTAAAPLDPYRAGLFRLILVLAAAYNLAFGLWAGLWPRAFFELLYLAPPLYPSIWRCLGMVVGIYGLAYGYAALRLDLARPFVALGLLGKVLGPLGWLLTVGSGEWPARTFTLIVFNDLVWWAPFGLFLLEGTRLGARLRALAPELCAALNALAAAVLLLVLRPGTEAVADLTARAAYIAGHLAAWRLGWGLWMAAALSLLGFYAWWGARVPRRRWARIAFVTAAAGLVCDLFAESLFIGWLPARIDAIQPAGALLTSGLANGLYTLAGAVLTAATPALRGGLRRWAWAAWLCGLALSLAALLGSVPAMAVSAAALMLLFCPLALALGRRLR